MALEGSKIKKEDQTFSLDQLNPSFYNKIMSRYSLGYSKRISYHHRSLVNVPLEWEVQPGKPKIGKAPLVIKRSPPADMATATTATNSGVCKKVKKKQVDLGTLFRDEAKLLTDDNNNIDTSSGSEDYGDNWGLFISDCDEKNSSVFITSCSSSSSSQGSSSSATSSPKLRFQLVAKVLVKWAFSKPRKVNK